MISSQKPLYKFLFLFIYILLSLLWLIMQESIEPIDWIFVSITVTGLYLLLKWYEKTYTYNIESMIYNEDQRHYQKGIVLNHDEHKRVLYSLSEQEYSFRMLFENSEISIWNEDFRDVIEAVEELRSNGITNIHQYLSDNIDLAYEIVSKVKVVDVNRATLRLFKAHSKEQFLADIDSTFGDNAIMVFIDELTAIWEGKKFFRQEANYKTFEGDLIHGIVTFQIPQDKEHFATLSVSIIDITALKKTQEALRVSNEKFEKAFNQTPHFISISDIETGEMLDVNHKYEEVLGYKKTDIIGKSTLDLNIWNSKKDRDRFVHTFKDKGYLDGDMFSVNKQNGQPITAKLYANTITIGEKDYLLVVANDVTQKEQYLKELERKKRELETIIQVAPYPIIIHDKSGKIHMLNHAWSHYSGYKLEDLETIDKGITLMFDTSIQELVRKNIVERYNLTSSGEPTQYRIKTKSGEEAIWQFTTAPLGIVDGQETVVTSAVDITELKQKDDMLIAQSRHAAMGEMIGMIAHQWRQPLSSISMDANSMLFDIAMNELDLSRVEEYAKSIAYQTQHLSKTIDDFRNFFKPDKLLLRVNIEKTLNQTLTIVQNSLKNNNISLNIAYQSNEEVNAFPRELMQVFVNIINNAKGSLVVRKPKDPIINIRVYSDKKYLNIEICDNGAGIDDDVLPKVFNPYFSTKDTQRGTGMGLYMSQIIVQKHLNGKLEVYNNEQGACFKVRLMKLSKEKA